MSSLLFILPVSGGSGGAHSVMQEADAMRSLGIDAMIATNGDNAMKLRRSYRDLKTIQHNVFSYNGIEGLAALIDEKKPDVIVATTNQSVHFLGDALKTATHKGAVIGYYIQDYEPLFYQRNSNDWKIAHTSYGLIPNMVHFAKTRWLQETVSNNHNIPVYKVAPSVDHDVYFPNLDLRVQRAEKIVVTAMIRPATPRRAPRRTSRIISRIMGQFNEQVTCYTFGCMTDEMRNSSLRTVGAEHLGVLSREEVGDLFRTSDIFLDLSDFQAFGRTAIEAMSCGCTAILPMHGGAYEYAEDGRNCFLVDVRNDEAVMSCVEQYLSMSDQERLQMSMDGIKSGYKYSPEIAAISEIDLLFS